MTEAIDVNLSELTVEPILQYPSMAIAGTPFLLTIDLKPQQFDASWPYPNLEEIPVHCVVSPGSLFYLEFLGEPLLIVHRYGGTYGPARFLLKSSIEHLGKRGRVRITLANSYGTPITSLETGEIEVVASGAPDFVNFAESRIAGGVDWQLEDFPTQLSNWFKTLKYDIVREIQHYGKYFELVLRIPERRGYIRAVVRGVNGEAGIGDLRGLQEKVKELRADEGWLVAARRISAAAKKEAEKLEQNRENLFCYTFDELIDETADFTPYVEWLEAEIRNKQLEELYVPVGCKKEDVEPETQGRWGESVYLEQQGWTEGYLDTWLDDPAKEHISILGEFGTGKTWLVLHYAWVKLQAYLAAKEKGLERPRLPLVIQLRDYAKALDVESMLGGLFFSRYNIRLTSEMFERLNRMGKFVLIFDGLDEMAARVDTQRIVGDFWELAKVVVPGAKAVLTCRTEHFPDAQRARDTLAAMIPASFERLSGEPPQFEVLELLKFDEEQIREVLGKRAAEQTVEKVMGTPQLLDLARRPAFLELVLEALAEIEAGMPIDLARLFLYAMRRKMERDIETGRTFTSLADKLFFLCELSWEILSTDRMSLNYREFPERLQNLFGPVVVEQKELDHWRYDMLGQTLLIRNGDGDYMPAHRSLLEFFVAYKFAAELGVLAEDFVAVAQQQRTKSDTVPVAQKWSEYFSLGYRKLAVPLQQFTLEPMEKLVQTVGKSPLAKPIWDLLVPMVRRSEKTMENLQAAVEFTRGLELENVGYVGGNAATLLVRLDSDGLLGLNISGCVLVGANLSGAILRDVNLSGANLRNADLSRTDLSGANLRNIQYDEYTRWPKNFNPPPSR